MSDEPGNLPPPPSYEAATQGQPPPDVGQKNTPYPIQTPHPQPYGPQQYPQQSYPGYPQYPPGPYPPSGQYPPGTNGYPSPGYNYNTYSGNVAPMVSPGTYTGAAFMLTPEQMQQRRRKQLIMFFTIGIVMIVVFVIIVSSQMG